MTDKAPDKSTENGTFESALERLEAIVRKLESGELPLDESLLVFEEGIRLSGFCHKRLDEVEKKVQLLLADGSRVPFEPDALGGGSHGKGD